MPHLTTPLAFHETGPAHHNHLLFSVTPDIPAVHALHSASELLSAAAHQAFLLSHALRAVKATVDALGQAPAD